MLECPVSSESGIIFYEWSKGEDVIEDNYSRFKVNDETGILRIRSVKVSDSGTYTCSAVNGHGETRVSLELDVAPKVTASGRGRVLDERVDQTSLQTIYSRQESLHDSLESKKPYRPVLLEITSSGTPGNRYSGDNVTLGCRFQSRPLPDIKWFFNQVLIGQKQQSRKTAPQMSITTTTSGEIIESKLFLSNVQENSTGRYSCQASNRKGMKSGSTELIIPPGYRPKIIGDHPLNSTFIEGQTLTLYCRVSSEEQPTIQWVRKTVVTEPPTNKSSLPINVNTPPPLSRTPSQSTLTVPTTNRQKMRSETMIPQVHYRGSNIYESILVVNHSQLNDSGLYMCTAWNPIHKAMAWREAHVSVIRLHDESISVTKHAKSSSVSLLIEEDQVEGEEDTHMRFSFVPNIKASSQNIVLSDNPLVFWVIGLAIMVMGLIGVLVSKMFLKPKERTPPKYITDLELLSRSKRFNASNPSRLSMISINSSQLTPPLGKPGSTPPPRMRRKQFQESNNKVVNYYPRLVSAPAQIHNIISEEEKNLSLKRCNCHSCHQSQVDRLKSLDRFAIQSQNQVNQLRQNQMYHYSLDRRPQRIHSNNPNATTLSRNYFYPMQDNPDEIQVIS